MSFLITTAAIGAGSALYGIGKGIAQGAQANKIDKNNPRPSYEIPQEYINNVNMARQMAEVGLPQQQYNNQLNNINQNQAAGLQVLNNSANPGAGVVSAIRAADAATNTLNAQDAAARQANQRFYIGQNTALGQQKLAQQQYNKFDKYTEQFNKAAALRGAANQNVQNGVNALSTTAMNLYDYRGNTGNDPETLGPRVAPKQLSNSDIPQQTYQSLLPSNTGAIANPTGLGIYTRYKNPSTNGLDRFSYTQNLY